MLLAILFLTSCSVSFNVNKIPDFDDGQWKLVEESPLGGLTYIWGRIKKYELIENPNMIGIEEFAFSDQEAFFKRWGRDKQFFNALKEKDSGSWLLGFPYRSRWEVVFDFDVFLRRIKGVWVLLFRQPEGNVSGRYFPDPSPKPISRPLRKGERAL